MLNDIKQYGLRVALHNARFNLAWRVLPRGSRMEKR
jgi:hypothetical protein